MHGTYAEKSGRAFCHVLLATVDERHSRAVRSTRLLPFDYCPSPFLSDNARDTTHSDSAYGADVTLFLAHLEHTVTPGVASLVSGCMAGQLLLSREEESAYTRGKTPRLTRCREDISWPCSKLASFQRAVWNPVFRRPRRPP